MITNGPLAWNQGVIWSHQDKGNLVAVSGNGLTVTINAGSMDEFVRCTVGKSTGKWYWENRVTAASTVYNIGIAQRSQSVFSSLGSQLPSWSYVMFLSVTNKINNNVQTAYGATYGNGDIIAVALDMTAGQVTMYKNNVSQGVMYTGLTGTIYPAIGNYLSNACSYVTNFGATAFAFTPPAGFIALTP